MAAWVALHKEVRPLVATGRLVRGDHHDPAVLVTGVVAPDRSEAWYVVATVDTPLTQSVGAVRLPGLDPGRAYSVSERTPAGRPAPRRARRDLAGRRRGPARRSHARARSAYGSRRLAPEAAHVLHATLA